MLIFHRGRLAALALLISTVAAAQQIEPKMLSSSPGVLSLPNPLLPKSCNPWRLQVLPAELSFRERSCLQMAQLASPGGLLQAGFAAGYTEWRDRNANPRKSEEFSRIVANIYARRTARATAELVMGYLHHEDPRPHSSGETRGWRRTRAALLSVVESADRNGHAGPAFAPLAGALGSGFAAMGVYQYNNRLSDAMRLSGLVYSQYFVRALAREFKPELWSLAPRFIRKHANRP